MNKEIAFRKKVFLFLFLNLIVGCSSHKYDKDKDIDTKDPFITSKDSISGIFFQNKKHNFGTIDSKKHEYISFDFDFTNEMKIPLVIYKAEVSCGCISAEIPNHPINHGDRGTIKITVDAKKILGKFNKTVFIKSNSQNEKVVLLRVEGIIK